jgi:hypothetical protein
MCLDASQNKSYPAADLPIKDRLNLWLDAADDTTFSYSSGTTISQWRDKSGQNNHAIVNGGSPVRSVAINSRKAVSFTSTSWFKCTTGTFASNATHFLVCRATTSSATYQRVYNGGSDGYLFFGALANNIATFWGTLSSGWIDTNVNSPSITILNTLRIISAINNGSTGTPYYDGTAMSTKTTTNSFAYTGYELNSYSNGILSQPLIGEVCEIIVFNKQLSATELKQVHTYLGQKWGISNTDRSIVDLAGNDDNGLFGNATVANMPDYDFYNKGALTFNGTSDYTYQSLFANAITTTLTFDVWVKFSDTGSSGRYIMSLGRDIGGPSGGIALLAYGFSSVNSGQITFEFGSGYGRVSSGIVPTTGIWYNLTVTTDGTNTRFYVNSVLANTSSQTTGAVASSPGLSIGSYLNSATPPIPGTYFFNGNIGSVKIYNKTLSQSEISQNYEAQKSKFANTIVQNGLVLNVDAGNPYSYAGAGSVWYDVSGNSNNGTLIGSPSYTSTNNGGIIFDSVAKYVTLPASGLAFGTGQFAIEAWVFSTAAVSYNHIYSSQSSNNVGFISLYYQNGYGFSVADLGNSAVRTATTHQTVVSQNTWYHVVGIRNASNQYIVYVNGVVSTTNSTSSYPLTATAPQIASNPASNTERFTGTIASFRLYTRSLSATEVLQNYNATKSRFGL